MTQDPCETPDGLRLVPHPDGWQVEIAKTFPQRLGAPESVDLPRVGARLDEGDVLIAIELAKARVEFPAPFPLVVCHSDTGRAKKHSVTFDADAYGAEWHLVITRQHTILIDSDSSMRSDP